MCIYKLIFYVPFGWLRLLFSFDSSEIRFMDENIFNQLTNKP